MKTALMVAIIVLSSSAGEVMITKGMKQVGEIATLSPRALLSIAARVLTNAFFLGGLAMMAVSFFSLLAVMSWADLSFTIPATSLSFVVSIIGAKLFLKEEIDRARLIGIILICAGVALVALSEQ